MHMHALNQMHQVEPHDVRHVHGLLSVLCGVTLKECELNKHNQNTKIGIGTSRSI
jgi:hypothetical protein